MIQSNVVIRHCEELTSRNSDPIDSFQKKKTQTSIECEMDQDYESS